MRIDSEILILESAAEATALAILFRDADTEFISDETNSDRDVQLHGEHFARKLEEEFHPPLHTLPTSQIAFIGSHLGRGSVSFLYYGDAKEMLELLDFLSTPKYPSLGRGFGLTAKSFMQRVLGSINT